MEETMKSIERGEHGIGRLSGDWGQRSPPTMGGGSTGDWQRSTRVGGGCLGQSPRSCGEQGSMGPGEDGYSQLARSGGGSTGELGTGKTVRGGGCDGKIIVPSSTGSACGTATGCDTATFSPSKSKTMAAYKLQYTKCDIKM